MNKNHQFIRGIILFGFQMLMLKITFSGHLIYYVAPRMAKYIEATIVLLFILSILLIGRSFLSQSTEDHHDDSHDDHSHAVPRGWFKNVLIYGIMLVPLILGFTIPEKVLSSSIAEKKGITLSSEVFSRHGVVDKYSELAIKLYKQDRISLDDKTFVDGISVLDWYKDKFVGKEVELYGFVYREPGMEYNQMIIARFSVSCCTADATVYGMLSELDSAEQYKTDSWVKVRGTTKLVNYKGEKVLALQVNHIEPIKPPASPYLYQQNSL